jgi:nitroreductase
MEIDGFLDLVKKRRSMRRFKPDPIPDGAVEKILEAARWAMSGANGQPWEFVVVKDRETIARIVGIREERHKRAHVVELTRREDLRHPGVATRPVGAPAGFRDAPVIIVVCGDPRTYQATVLGAHFRGVTDPTYNIHLAAAALGLGAQWVSIGPDSERQLEDLLGIPEVFNIYAVVPVGYPAYRPAPSYRRELSEIVHYERYDESKYRSDEGITDFLVELRNRTRGAYAAQHKT